MKKTAFFLPIVIVFASCSSSRKAVAPATPGISNVNVTRNDTVTSAANASSSFTSADRDWAYTATRDTTLNGTWVLEGMAGADGQWSSSQTSNKDTSASTTDTAMVVTNETTTDTAGTATATSQGRNMGKRGRTKNNRRALYDSAQARLRLDYKTTAALDTADQPFQYWGRIPTVTLNAKNLVFTGTTGCNSMSGSFNFNNKDIQFGRNIITSKMSCNEYNETNFISALKKADNYTLNGNTLELKQGGTRLLTFKKA
ncbi:MAG: hypothetical protein AVDCRST_MAG96-3737 [uncultured Segetibacter sp.]|uniref:DUF306 domain-containing protein n=1 Tax=uncultured Segetibacter sp. TaxID=481133 RepID=A0A6J4TW10_9BACT|nr:MAG: hypothetical protein AVDCRST_MAG96-3737 [uncultured Segetibacter sp.]